MTSADNEQIVGLDEMQYVYICHKSRPDQLFKISTDRIFRVSPEVDECKRTHISELLNDIVTLDSSLIDDEKNPIILEKYTFEAFSLIMNYILFYEQQDELPEPPKFYEPGYHNTKNGILLQEMPVFQPLVGSILDLYVRLYEIMMLANYMQMHKLCEKIASIIAYKMRSLSPDKHTQLIEINQEIIKATKK